MRKYTAKQIKKSFNRQRTEKELFPSVYRQSVAPLRQVDEGVKKTLDNYIEDLILLGKE